MVHGRMRVVAAVTLAAAAAGAVLVWRRARAARASRASPGRSDAAGSRARELDAAGADRASGRFWERLEPALVAGDSMRPTLPPGARVAVAPVRGPLARGQLVVVGERALPPGLGLPPRMVKRVVGLPGEHVRVDAAGLWVDGRRLPEPWLRVPRQRATAAAAGAGFEVRLADGEYLVLGDRREASTDGRAFGPVRLDDLDGIVRFAYWPLRSLFVTMRGRWFWHHAWAHRKRRGGVVVRPQLGRSFPQS